MSPEFGSKMKYNKNCKVCLKAFIAESPRTTYCSEDCKLGRNCIVCKKRFLQGRHTTGKFCSSECWYDNYEKNGGEWKSVMPEKKEKKIVPTIPAPDNATDYAPLYPKFQFTKDFTPFIITVSGDKHRVHGVWKKCEQCQNPFPTIDKTKKYCNQKCFHAFRTGANHQNQEIK